MVVGLGLLSRSGYLIFAIGHFWAENSCQYGIPAFDARSLASSSCFNVLG